MLRLISCFLLSACFATAFATELSGDAQATRNCRAMPMAADRKECAEVVKGHKFHTRVLDVCSRGRDYADDYGPFAIRCFREIRDHQFDDLAVRVCESISDDDSALDCLKMIAERAPENAKALVPCGKILKDKEIMGCVRQVTWRPLAPEKPAGVVK